MRPRALPGQIRRLPKEALWRWQRARRGYSEADTWSLDHYLATVIVGGCKRLRERDLAHPSALTATEWDDVLDTIIAGFERWLEEPWDAHDDPVYTDGMAAFGKWFSALWD